MPDSTFVCLGCGNCCRPHGMVRVSAEEITNISQYLEINETDFIEQYTALCPDRRGLTLIEQASGACIFLTEQGRCRIHDCKPEQCKGFPERWTDPLLEKNCLGLKKIRGE